MSRALPICPKTTCRKPCLENNLAFRYLWMDFLSKREHPAHIRFQKYIFSLLASPGNGRRSSWPWTCKRRSRKRKRPGRILITVQKPNLLFCILFKKQNFLYIAAISPMRIPNQRGFVKSRCIFQKAEEFCIRWQELRTFQKPRHHRMFEKI